MNGLSESLIRWAKRILEYSIKNKRLTHGELQTYLFQVADIMNSRPIGKRPNVDPLDGGPVTPNHLLLGRATSESAVGDFDVSMKITQRTEMISELLSAWWKKWYAQAFSSLVPAYRWQQKHREVQPGDVVLMYDDNDLKGHYQLARVKKTIERAIHSLVVIVPNGYSQDEMEADLDENSEVDLVDKEADLNEN